MPVRGRQLRDRYVLRLIALDRAIHVLLLTIFAVAIFAFVSKRSTLQHEYDAILDAIGGPSSHGLLGKFRHLFTIRSKRLYEIAAVVIVYAGLEATEMVGLWLAKRWAEYLTFVATVLLLPFEVYELVDSVTVLKVVTFIINVAIAVYLMWAKRLFGVRGGGTAARAGHEEGAGWRAIDRASPVGPPSVVSTAD